VVARGATLAALRSRGLRVEQPSGAAHVSHPAAGTPAELGPQDHVFLTVKAHGLTRLAAELAPLLAPCTTVSSGTNGIPWWFFQDCPGPLADAVLSSVDPGGIQAAAFPRGWALGTVVHASMRVRAPGDVQVVAAERLIVGEPDGTASPRVDELVAALRAGGINAHSTPRIREEVWAKLWGNMTMNPLSALTRSGTAALLADPQVRALCIRMMEEMQACGRVLGLDVAMTPAQRIAVTLRLGDFRTSMLMDLEAARPLEIEPQLGAVVEIADRLGVDAPQCRTVLSLVRLLSVQAVAQRPL
jgi:2-dehydropantoate 2-reductase